VIDSVVTCTPCGTEVPGGVHALSCVSEATTASGPSSISRSLSREFRLREDVRNQDDRKL
jgi:hypothetical protein